jgi:secondary thiamine-phosphate synthase enzyme
MMQVITADISLNTIGNGHACDITPQVNDHIVRAKLDRGTITVFVPGSTAAVTTIEFEPGAVSDFQKAFERAVPEDIPYQHDQRWGDGNGFSHVKAAWLGPSVTIPFVNGKLCLGTWQQIILIDFDRHPRHRKVVLQIIGQ